MLSGLRHHRTEEFLSEIDVPALILAGRRDWFTPPSVQERMAALIPGSEILWFEEAGHLLPVEAAAEIPAAIVDFLSRRVVGARPRSPRNVPAG
jgi:proline iminopeptidase